MSEKEDIVSKIQKLMALSKSSNEYEAAAALAQALKLSRKYQIDLDKIGSKDERVFSTEELLTRWGYEPWETNLFVGISELFACRILHRDVYENGHKRKILLAGEEADRKQAAFLCTFLRRALMKLWTSHKKEVMQYQIEAEWKVRKDFLFGAVETVLKTATEMFSKEIEYSESQAIVLKKICDVDRWLAEDPKIRKARERSVRIDPSACQQGRSAAEEININRSLDCEKKSQSLLN